VDAALGSMVRYLDQALGPQGIRVQVLSCLPPPPQLRKAARTAPPLGVVAMPTAPRNSGLHPVH